jgi:hypothetical protein
VEPGVEEGEGEAEHVGGEEEGGRGVERLSDSWARDLGRGGGPTGGLGGRGGDWVVT